MKVGYARGATDDQDLTAQIDALNAAGCGKIFIDQGVSGLAFERFGLSQALLSVGSGDVLVVWRLDRLSRSLNFLVDLIETLRGGGAKVQSLTDGIENATATGNQLFRITRKERAQRRRVRGQGGNVYSSAAPPLKKFGPDLSGIRLW
jgi:DNA invertase Pin-like site-specific DNA recombinase